METSDELLQWWFDLDNSRYNWFFWCEEFRAIQLACHLEEVSHFIKMVQGSEKPVLSFASMYPTTLATFKVNESLQRGTPIELS